DQAETYLGRSELKDLYLLGSDLKEKISRPQEALNLRKKYEVLSDSMLNERTQNSIQEQEIKYQSSLKEKAIAQQKLKLAHNLYELQKKDKWIMLFVTVSGFFLTLALLIYLVNLQRQKTLLSERKSQLLQARLSGEEKERSRQARELHDGVGGILSAAKMQMSTMQDAVEISNANAYEQTLSLINYAAREVRNISHNLAPDIVLNEGLEKAIMRFCQRVSYTGLTISHYVIGQIPSLKSDYELMLYRIVQEAVNNVIKHSKAGQAIVQLSVDESILSITVEDDGIGFDSSNIFSKGLGLSNMKERTAELGGNVEISSSPYEGTTVYLEFDIEPHLSAISVQKKLNPH
ncbi:MAG TPA: sensor histidine kinase, partial [Pedobacter sp.]|nr:sensor histidine kinase [Pedobacter sp.]